MEETLQAAAQNLSTSSTKRRVAIFRDSVAPLLDSSDENPADYATSLVELIFQTLHIYNDRTSLAAVEFVIVKALKEPAFVRLFAGMLIQIVEKSVKISTTSEHYKLLRWSCLLVRWNPGIRTAKAAFAKLTAIQASLVSSLLQGSFRVRRASKIIFFRMLSEVQDLFPLYINELKGTHLSADCTYGLISILLDYCSRDAELFDNHKVFFLDLYIRVVLSTKEKPSAAMSYAFTPLLKKLTHEDFEKVLVPVAVKMLKRNPELVLEAVGILLKLTNLDLSKYVGNLLSVLLVQVRHNDEGRRKESVSVISNLALQSSDPDAISSMFQIMKANLEGSEGKLTFPFQRVGVINSLYSLSTAPGGKALTQLAATICQYLLSYYKDDGNEEVRISVLSALGVWMSRAGDSISDNATAFFMVGLKERENLRRSHLRCLRLAFKNLNLSTKMHPLLEVLLNLSKNGATKPSQRVDSIYALLILFHIASVDVRADDRIVKERLWTLVVQKDSTIFSTSLVGKLQAEDCVALVELVEVIVLKHSSRLTEHVQESQQLFQLVVLFLWYTSLDVRKAAFEAVRRFHSASLKFSEELFDSFASWLPIYEDQMVLIKFGDTENLTDSSALIVPSDEALAKALISLIVPGLFSNCNTIARLLLVCHHRCLVRGRRTDIVWKAVVRNLTRQRFNVADALAADPRGLCEFLLGPFGVLSGRHFESQAALHGLHTAMRTIPIDFFPKFLSVLESLIDRTAHDRLSEIDIKIFHTSPETLSTKYGVYIGEVVADKNVKQAKGRFKMYEDVNQVCQAKCCFHDRVMF